MLDRLAWFFFFFKKNIALLISLIKQMKYHLPGLFWNFLFTGKNRSKLKKLFELAFFFPDQFYHIKGLKIGEVQNRFFIKKPNFPTQPRQMTCHLFN